MHKFRVSLYYFKHINAVLFKITEFRTLAIHHECYSSENVQNILTAVKLSIAFDATRVRGSSGLTRTRLNVKLVTGTFHYTTV